MNDKELMVEEGDLSADPVLDVLTERVRGMGCIFRSKRGVKDPYYQRLVKYLSNSLGANAYVVSRDGKILSHSRIAGYTCSLMRELLESNFFPEAYTSAMNDAEEPLLQHSISAECTYLKHPCSFPEKSTLFVPVFSRGLRLGTVAVVRFGRPFEKGEVLFAEMVAALVSVEFPYCRSMLKEDPGKERLLVQMAMKSLSYAEVEAARHILEELGGPDGVVVASKVADQVGVTRNVIVGALKKLASAGIVESQSLGVKGTYIRVLSNLFLDELGVLTYVGRTR